MGPLLSATSLASARFIFQGPALYAFNNAQFSDNDWLGLKMINDSIKKNDALKVGRFGLGFKSVFHMTGRLICAFL